MTRKYSLKTERIKGSSDNFYHSLFNQGSLVKAGRRLTKMDREPLQKFLTEYTSYNEKVLRSENNYKSIEVVIELDNYIK